MKTLLKFTILLFVQVIVAQYPVLTTTNLTNASNDNNYATKGNYAKDVNNERNQYVGLWRYIDATTVFELKIEKKDQYLDWFESNSLIFYRYTDVVIFKYKLIKNGIVVFDNLNDVIPNENYLSQAIVQDGKEYLYGRMVDFTRNVSAVVTVNRMNTLSSKIFFDLSSGAYRLLNPISYYEGSTEKLFIIPTDGIEMVKVD